MNFKCNFDNSVNANAELLIFGDKRPHTMFHILEHNTYKCVTSESEVNLVEFRLCSEQIELSAA